MKGVLACGTVHYVVQGSSNFWVCGRNPRLSPNVQTNELLFAGLLMTIACSRPNLENEREKRVGIWFSTRLHWLIRCSSIKYDLENENRSPYETRVTVSVDFTAITILVSKAENRHGFRADQFDTSTSLPLPRLPGITTFEGWIVQIPYPRGKKAVQMPRQ